MNKLTENQVAMDKKNLVRVTMTEKGKKTLKNSMKRESIRKTFAALSKEDRKQLYTQLEKLRAKGLKLSGFPKPPFPKSL